MGAEVGYVTEKDGKRRAARMGFPTKLCLLATLPPVTVICSLSHQKSAKVGLNSGLLISVPESCILNKHTNAICLKICI